MMWGHRIACEIEALEFGCRLWRTQTSTAEHTRKIEVDRGSGLRELDRAAPDPLRRRSGLGLQP